MSTISLSPLDYYFYRDNLYTLQFAFEFEGVLDINLFESSLHQLSLEEPIYFSVLKRSGEKLELDITPRKIPVQQCAISGLFETIQEEVQHNFFQPIHHQDNESLIKISVLFHNHKTVIGFSVSHLLGDGISFFYFIKNLSEKILNKPLTKIYNENRDQLLLPTKTFASDYYQNFYQNTYYETDSPPQSEKCILIKAEMTFDELKKLRRSLSIQNQHFTNNDALMAYLVKNYYHHIPQSPSGEILVRFPIDIRPYLNHVPQAYFGNAFKDVVTTFTQRELLSYSLSEIALKMREKLNEVNQNSIQEYLYSFESIQIKNGIDSFKNIGCPGMVISNLTSIDFKQIDFSLGNPTNIYHGKIFPRAAVLLPSPTGVSIRFQCPQT